MRSSGLVTGVSTREVVTMGEVNGLRKAPPLQQRVSVPESFEDVYRRESLGMVRLAFLMVGSRQLAEEIVQEAFARLLERWDNTQSPGAYLRTCVVNGYKGAYRRRALERRTAAREPDPDPVSLGVDDLNDALAALPPRRRAAILLRYYGGLSEAEIAGVLRVRPGTVKSLLSRGLAQLREVIER